MTTDSFLKPLALAAVMTTAAWMVPNSAHAAAQMYMIGACQVYETDQAEDPTTPGTVLVRCPQNYNLSSVGTYTNSGGNVGLSASSASNTTSYSTNGWVKYQTDRVGNASSPTPGQYLVELAAGAHSGFTPLLRDPGNQAVLVSGKMIACQPGTTATGSASVMLPATTARLGKFAPSAQMNFDSNAQAASGVQAPQSCSLLVAAVEPPPVTCKEGDKDCVVDPGTCKEGDKDCVVPTCKEGDKDCVVPPCRRGEKGCTPPDVNECRAGDRECLLHYYEQNGMDPDGRVIDTLGVGVDVEVDPKWIKELEMKDDKEDKEDKKDTKVDTKIELKK